MPGKVFKVGHRLHHVIIDFNRVWDSLISTTM